MYKSVMLWLPVILWMSLIFYLSSIPDLKSGLEPEIDTILRKLAHIIEYTILMFLFVRALSKQHLQIPFQKLLPLAFLLSLLYAVSDELHQLFVPGREGTLRDVTIDSIGITVIPLLLTSKNRVAKILATYLEMTYIQKS